MKNTVLLLSNCLGINNLTDNSAKINWQTGDCELADCVGLVNEGDRLVAESSSVVKYSGGDIVNKVSGLHRFIFHIGTGLYVQGESGLTRVTYNGSPLVVSGEISFLHTFVDIRFAVTGVLYKLLNSSTEAVLATVGTYGGPTTSVVFQGMPAVSNGFVWGGRIFILDGEFIKYSETWYYDCWNYGDSYIYLGDTAIQGRAINGLICVICEKSVVVLQGTGVHDLKYSTYPIKAYKNSIASGFISEIGTIVMFLADTGLYVVTSDGAVTNISKDKVDSFEGLTCNDAIVLQEEGYKVFTTTGTWTYLFGVKGLFRSDDSSVVSIGKVSSTVLAGKSNDVVTLTGSGSVKAKMEFPALDFSMPGMKRLRRIRISGKFLGTFTVTCIGKYNSELCTYTCTSLREIVEFTGFGKLVDDYVKIVIEFIGDVFELDKVHATVYQVR